MIDRLQNILSNYIDCRILNGREFKLFVLLTCFDNELITFPMHL